MRDVHAWVSNPDKHFKDVREMLQRSLKPGLEDELVHFVTTNARTRSSITQSIRPALMWLHDPGAAHAAEQPVTGPVIDATGVSMPNAALPPLDIEALLYQCGTVYLLGAEEAQTAPLLTASTGHIAPPLGRSPGGSPRDGWTHRQRSPSMRRRLSRRCRWTSGPATSVAAT